MHISNYSMIFIAAFIGHQFCVCKADGDPISVREQAEIKGSGSYEESYNRNWYKLYYGSGEVVNWVTAFKRCRSIGYHLVDLESENDIRFINEFVSRSGLRKPHAIWSSGSDSYEYDNFIWMSNGKGVDATLWDSGEPNNAGGSEHCVALRDKGTYYKINDVNCNEKWTYICKQKNGNPDF